jgi:ABC-2 type transport system permease protein
MRLLGVELTRFVTRRAVVVVLLAALVLTVVMVAAAAYNTRSANGTETAAAERMMNRQDQLNEAEYQRCLEDPEEYFGRSVEADGCGSLRPALEWYLPRATLDLGAEVPGRGRLLLVSLAGMGVLVGAFFAGRDWTTGSMSTQLLHEPRRAKVWLTKALAVVVGATVAATLLLAVFWGSLAGFAQARGIDTTSEAWRLVAETSGRGLALVAAVALGGFALTMGLRHTVATLGLLFGYAVVGEGLAASLPFEKMSQWSLANNVLAWVHDGVEVRDGSICSATVGACSPTYVLSAAHAAAYLGGLLLLAVAASLVTFLRRDVE